MRLIIWPRAKMENYSKEYLQQLSGVFIMSGEVF